LSTPVKSEESRQVRGVNQFHEVVRDWVGDLDIFGSSCVALLPEACKAKSLVWTNNSL
jgi:hypothetical protein